MCPGSGSDQRLERKPLLSKTKMLFFIFTKHHWTELVRNRRSLDTLHHGHCRESGAPFTAKLLEMSWMDESILRYTSRTEPESEPAPEVKGPLCQDQCGKRTLVRDTGRLLIKTKSFLLKERSGKRSCAADCCNKNRTQVKTR